MGCNVKKILFVMDILQAGGGAQKVLKLAMQTLVQNGYDIELVALKKSQNEIDLNGFKVHYILPNTNERLLNNSFVILDKLKELSSKVDYVAVFIDFITLYFATIAVKIAPNRPKLIAFVRSRLSLASKLFNNPELNMDLELLSLKSANVVVANSIECLNELKEFNVSNTHLLYNPIKTTNLNYKQNSKNYAIAIGRIDSSKDHYTMIKAFKKANIKGLKLLIFGSGQDKAVNELKELIDDANIELMGYSANVSEYIKEAKFFVQTSIFEGLSNAVLECYSYALPAVLSALASNKEIYKNDAIYCKCGDIDGFAGAIKTLNEELNSNSYKPFTPDLSAFSMKNFEKKLLEIFK